MLAKPKQKIKPQSFLHAWIFGERIEFIAHIPLEECVTRLAAKSEPRQWFSGSTPVIVTINPKTANHYRFQLEQLVASSAPVGILGDLKYIDNDSTLVTGQGMISPLTYFVMLLLV